MKFILFCLSLLLAHCSPALSGKIRGPGNEIVNFKQGKVNVVGLSKELNPTTLVLDIDDSGYFVAEEKLSDGPYLVEILLPGYKIESKKISLKDNEEIEFQLVPLAKAATKAIDINNEVEQGKGLGNATLTPPNL